MVAAVADEKGTSVQGRDYTRSCMSQGDSVPSDVGHCRKVGRPHGGDESEDLP